MLFLSDQLISLLVPAKTWREKIKTLEKMKRNLKSEHLIKPIGHVGHKHRLRARGWTNRAAARHLGYALSHFSLCLCGHRESKTLLKKVWEIPTREEIAK